MDQSNPPISIEYSDEITIVTLTSERILDDADIQALESSILPLLEQESRIKLLMDFTNVNFLTSAALGLLIRISKKVCESNGKLRLCNISPKIVEIFKITRLDTVFEIIDTREKGILSLS